MTHVTEYTDKKYVSLGKYRTLVSGRQHLGSEWAMKHWNFGNRGTHRGMWWRRRLRHSATSEKVAGSIHDGVIRIYHWLSPSGRTTAKVSTQPAGSLNLLQL